MRGPSFDEIPPNLSDELKKKFQDALKGKLAVMKCSTCPASRSFVPVVEFMIDMVTEAAERMDIASQRMEDFINVFNQLEERLMKARMLGEDGR